MWFSSWFGKTQHFAASRHRHGTPRKRPNFRPQLDSLEDRWLPSQVSLTVTSLADSGAGSLRDAILTADAGKPSDKFTINVAVSGTIDLQTPLPDLNNNIAIQGPGASSLTVERAAGYSFATAIIFVDSGQTASLSGLTVANGDGRGIVNSGTLTLANCAIVNNSAVASGGVFSGGGIFNGYLAKLAVSGCIVSGNSANLGGGISNYGSMTMSGSNVSGNSETESGDNGFGGGGIENWGTLTLSASILSNNSSQAEGGGIFNAGDASVSDCTLAGNSAIDGGGIFNAGTLTVTRTSLFANVAADFGGGLSNRFHGTLTVSGCTISGTIAGLSAMYGGGIYNDLVSSLTVRDSLLTGNSAFEGGGIFNGGIDPFSNDLPTLDVRGSTFTGNSATDSGGAIYNLGTAKVQGSNLSGNFAGSDGGGIFNGASGTLAVKDSAVLSNVGLLGADLFNDHGSVTVNDSLVGDWFNA